jgi:hypothetical protein
VAAAEARRVIWPPRVAAMGAALFGEAEVGERSQRPFVARPGVELDATQVELVEQVGDEQSESLGAVAMAPQVLLADRDPSFGYRATLSTAR